MGPQGSPATALRVAVTGHRDIVPGQADALREAVLTTLETISDRCRPARVELGTAMADGADQLAADAARELGLHVHVVLPKPIDEYRRELSERGRSTLDRVIAEAGVRVSTIHDPAGVDAAGDPALPYDRLGSYLARTAHVLIALWDGELERRPGGTLDVVTRFLDRSYEPVGGTDLPHRIDRLDATSDAPGPTVVWVRAARGETGASSTEIVYLVASGLPGLWYRSGEIPAPLTRLLHDLGVVASSAESLPPGGERQALIDAAPPVTDSDRRTALADIEAAFVVADRLAITHQRRSDRAFIGASVIAAVMGLAFLWFAKIDDNVGWLYLYLGLFAGGYLLFRATRNGRWLQHHLSMRLLAETLRIRYFTTLLGVARPIDVRRLLTDSGVDTFPGFSWANEADRIGVLTSELPHAGFEPPVDLLRRNWVEDQAIYFERRIERLERRHGRLERIQGILYVVSFAAAAVIIAFGADLKTIEGAGDVDAKTFLVFLMGLLPFWLTVWELHEGRMALRERLWQSRTQGQIFRRASTQLQRSRTPELAIGVFVELAERSLFETQLWTIHRFHREFSPPSGG